MCIRDSSGTGVSTFAGDVQIDGGNLGIGTAPTSRNLSVFRSSAGSIANFLHYTDSSNFQGLYIQVSQTTNDVILQSSGTSGGGFKFYSGNDEKAGIDTSGNATFAGNITATGGTLNLGNDVSIFDDGVNILRTDDAFHANNDIYIGGAGRIYDRANNATFIDLSHPNMTFTTPSGTATFTGNLETQGAFTVRDASSNHQVKIQPTISGTSRIMAHNTNIGTNHDLDIVSTQLDFLTGSISGSDNSRALFLDSSRNATFEGSWIYGNRAEFVPNTGAYDQIKIASNLTANTNKQAGIYTENYVGNNTSIFQYAANTGANSIYYGSADGNYRGITAHRFYVNASPTANSGHTAVS